MAAQSQAAAATAGSDHKNRNLIIFAAAIFVRLLSPLLLWQLKIFTLFAPVFKCCALQLLLLLLVPLFSSSPVLISYNSLRFSLVAPAQILHGHLLFCWTVAG